MLEVSFTVAIPTYNRAELLKRAIGSALDQDLPAAEVIVIDDCSDDKTREVVLSSYPQIRYLRQHKNCGVGAARNRAIREASTRWIVFLDDDDILLCDALRRIAGHMTDFPEAKRYPVLQFAHGNGMLRAHFMTLRLEDYLRGSFVGDFVPVIQREVFLTRGYGYPEFVRAGESLLWWKIASECGIPTWSDKVGNVGTDAPKRITSVEYQIAHADEYAELHEHVLEQFGDILASRFPAHYAKKRLGAAAYRLLAGQRSSARAHVRHALLHRVSPEAIGLGVATFLPRRLAQRVFRQYRRTVNGLER